MQQEILQSLDVLKKGGTLLYPTDTVWGLGCDATNASAVSKIFQIKQRAETKSMLCLVSNLAMLEKYVEVPDAAYSILEHANKPTTIIYDNPTGIAENMVAPNNTLGIRLVKHGFAHQLLQKFRKPIVSTSANISGFPNPKNFAEINPDILNSVDYVVNLPDENATATPSCIIRVQADGQVAIIRM